VRLAALALVFFTGIPLAGPAPTLPPNVSGRLESIQTQHSEQSVCRKRDTVNSADFEAILKAYGDARQAGDAKKASDCFTEDALFSSPPTPAHQGRETLFQLFGGNRKDPVPVKIQWHHFVFDPKQQIGAAEFTIQIHLQTHSVAFIKFSSGLISNWREYDTASGMDWLRFTSDNSF